MKSRIILPAAALLVPLIAEATALRKEVADRLDVGGDLDDLRQRFSDPSRAILALYVSAAEA